MDGIKNVDDLLKAKNLTPEEEHLLRDIIAECREREVQIKEVCTEARQNLENLSQNFGTIVQTIATVNRAVDQLHEEVERLQLKMMPEEQFYRD
jgi:DNA replication initiation complex subunit (GINS family)